MSYSKFGDAMAGGKEAWAKYQAERDRARAARKRRLPPRHGYKPNGTCQWCALPILYPPEHKRAGEPDATRGWHRECVGWHKVAAWTGSQRDYVWHRGHGRCALCRKKLEETACVGWRPRWPEFEHRTVERDHRNRKTGWNGLLYSPVEPIMRAGWDADHIVPLWSLFDVTLENRGCFFGGVNLWLLCSDCHARKTRREAEARAALRRLEREMADA